MTRLPDRAVWIDGRLCRGEAATLSLFDRGARDGEGLFETVRVYGGRPFAWQRHMERLVLSAAVLGFPVPASPVAFRAALDELLAAEGLGDAVARFTVTRGVPGGHPSRTGAWAEVEPLTARLWSGTRAGAGSVVVSKRRFEPGPLGAHKTTSRLAYHLAREEARVARVDEALLVRPSGEVLEGTVSNLFALMGGLAVTPPLASGILPGITRRLVMELAPLAGVPVREGLLTLEDLKRADELWLTNSVQEVVPIASLDGARCRRGPVAGRLLEAYRARVAEETATPTGR